MPPHPLRDLRPVSVRLADVSLKLRSTEINAQFAADMLSELSNAITALHIDAGVKVDDLVEFLYQEDPSVETALLQLEGLYNLLIRLEGAKTPPAKDHTDIPDESIPIIARGSLDETIDLDEEITRFFELGRGDEQSLDGDWSGPIRMPGTPKPEVGPLFEPATADDGNHEVIESLPSPDEDEEEVGHPWWSYPIACSLLIAVCLGMLVLINWPSEPTGSQVTPVVITEPPPLPTPEPITEVMAPEAPVIVETTPPPPEPPVVVSTPEVSVAPPVAEVAPPPAPTTVAVTEGTAFLILRDDQSRRGQWIFMGVAVTPDGHVLYHGAAMPETCLQVKAPGAYRASKACPTRELLYWFDS